MLILTLSILWIDYLAFKGTAKKKLNKLGIIDCSLLWSIRLFWESSVTQINNNLAILKNTLTPSNHSHYQNKFNRDWALHKVEHCINNNFTNKILINI